MCVHESWVSSEALSRSAVSKSRARVGVCADYTIVKVEPPTPSPVCYKYSYARAHTLRRTNSLLKDVSQVQQRELGGKMGRAKENNRRNVCVHR